MLRTKLIHPDMLQALAAGGHSSKILIADGNYPASSRLGPRAKLVSLNLTPGVISCTQALEAIVSAVPVEAAHVMAYATTGPYALPGDPPIWKEFSSILSTVNYTQPLEQVERFQFYDLAGGSDVVLTIQTGDQRIYANLLLTIGVVQTK